MACFWETGGLPLINIAMTCIVNEVLGPGQRFALWVQGCRKSCVGCMSPEWARLAVANLVSPAHLATRALRSPISGVTISGGEPMLQAAGLAEMLQTVREQRDITVICFTGYAFEELECAPPGPGVRDLLGHVDVLIDGAYVQELDDNTGMRGSSNQRFVCLTERLRPCIEDLQGRRRLAEIRVGPKGILLVGVPDSSVVSAFRGAPEKSADSHY